jgi:hypothetical protein
MRHLQDKRGKSKRCSTLATQNVSSVNGSSDVCSRRKCWFCRWSKSALMSWNRWFSSCTFSPNPNSHWDKLLFNQILLCKLLFIRIYVGIPNPFLSVWMLRVDQLLWHLLMLPQLVPVCCIQFWSSITKATSNLMCKSCRITSPDMQIISTSVRKSQAPCGEMVRTKGRKCRMWCLVWNFGFFTRGNPGPYRCRTAPSPRE